jgi:hypothetical protein
LLILGVSTLKGPELHMDVFKQQKLMLLLDFSTLQRPVRHPGYVN